MMDFLKQIPFCYKGELHEVLLVNFTVPMAEVKAYVPTGIPIRDFDGRAMISMVNVRLKRMRFSFIPKFLGFNYQHIAFRLLIEDSLYNDGQNKGIFFLQSFTNSSLATFGGNLLTDYQLHKAAIKDNDTGFRLKYDQGSIHYKISEDTTAALPELKKVIGALDRAYSIRNGRLMKVQIQRKKWPLEEVECEDFENTFFQDVKLEGAFRVPEVIRYTWKPYAPVV